MLKRHAPFINFARRLLDVALIVAVTLLIGQKYGPPIAFRGLAIYGSLLAIFFFAYFDLYRSLRQQSLFTHIRQLAFAWACVVITMNIIVLVMANEEQFKILWPFTLLQEPLYQAWVVSCFCTLALARILVTGFLYYIRKRGYNVRRVTIVGTGKVGLKLGDFIAKNKWMGLQLVGYFSDSETSDLQTAGPDSKPPDILGSIDDLATIEAPESLDMVFIALPMRAEKEINRLAQFLGTSGVSVFIVPDLFTLGIHRAKIRFIGELPFMDINLVPAWKRSFDLLFSTSVLFMTIPIWLLIMVLIKIEDRGPIIYRHTRIAESGKRFKCLKFRTMHPDADKKLNKLLENDPALKTEWRSNYKLKNDPRVTRIGKFLRKTSLDELPQFLNVIRGDMSVVGVRPIVEEELDYYYKEIALVYCAMKPGITGPWQIGQRSDVVDYADRVEQDRRYVLSCTLWRDIKIILMTVWRVVRPKGAY